MQPTVTVIVPVHNGAQYIAECLESVLAQTYTDWECIVAENCSTDDTYAIAKTFPDRDSRVQVRKFEELLPVIPNHNRAFALLPEYSIYFKPLMADDFIVPDCLELMVARMQANPSIGLVAGYVFDGNGVWNGFPHPASFVPGRDALKIALTRMGMSSVLGNPSGVMLRSDIIRRRNPLYDDFNTGADTETFLDILAESDFSFIHQVAALNRAHFPSVATQAEWLDAYEARDALLLHRYGPRYLAPAEFEEAKSRVMHTYYGRLAHRWFRRDDREKYWSWHRENFRRMGVPMSSSRLAVSVFREFLIRTGRRLHII